MSNAVTFQRQHLCLCFRSVTNSRTIVVLELILLSVQVCLKYTASSSCVAHIPVSRCVVQSTMVWEFFLVFPSCLWKRVDITELILYQLSDFGEE